MTSTTQGACASRSGEVRQRPAASRLEQVLQILRRLPQAYRIYYERRALLSLSDRSLKDLGLSRADAFREASQPWWKIPDNR